MDKDLERRVAMRASWLADLSIALDEAQMLLERIAGERIDQGDVELLRRQIEDLRTELRMFRRRGLAWKGHRFAAPDST